MYELHEVHVRKREMSTHRNFSGSDVRVSWLCPTLVDIVWTEVVIRDRICSRALAQQYFFSPARQPRLWVSEVYRHRFLQPVPAQPSPSPSPVIESSSPLPHFERKRGSNPSIRLNFQEKWNVCGNDFCHTLLFIISE